MGINVDNSITINRNGFGQDNTGAGQRYNRGQFNVWTRNCTNGTYNVRTDSAWIENGYAGHFYVSAVQGGKGTCRVYRITGRYQQTTLSMLQGGTRGGGEDCTLSANGSSSNGNSLQIQVNVSGYSGNVEVTVVYVGACSRNGDGQDHGYWMLDN